MTPTNSQRSPSSRRYDESEPSSVGSSRNPSPVSIASSTASSSIASAVEINDRFVNYLNLLNLFVH